MNSLFSSGEVHMKHHRSSLDQGAQPGRSAADDSALSRAPSGTGSTGRGACAWKPRAMSAGRSARQNARQYSRKMSCTSPLTSTSNICAHLRHTLAVSVCVLTEVMIRGLFMSL